MLKSISVAARWRTPCQGDPCQLNSKAHAPQGNKGCIAGCWVFLRGEGGLPVLTQFMQSFK